MQRATIILAGNRERDRQSIADYLAEEGLTRHFSDSGLRLGGDLFQQLLDYWHDMRSGDQLPGRRHLRPEEMRHLLPYLVLYDVVRQVALPSGAASGYRFRARLVGTHFVEMMGKEISGHYLDEETDPAGYAALRARLSMVIDQKRAVFGISTLPAPRRDFIRYAHLTLPLAADGDEVDMLLGARINLTTLLPADTNPATARIAAGHLLAS